MWFELLCLRESLKPKWRAHSLPSSSSRTRSKASTSLDPPSSNHGVPMGCPDQGSTLPFMSTFKFVLFPPQRILLVLRLSLYVLCVNLPHLDGFIPLSVISATNTPHHQLWLQNRFRMWEIHTSEPTSLSSFGLHFSGPASAMTLSSLWLLHSEKMCLFQTKKTFRWFCQGLGIKLNWIKNK